MSNFPTQPPHHLPSDKYFTWHTFCYSRLDCTTTPVAIGDASYQTTKTVPTFKPFFLLHRKTCTNNKQQHNTRVTTAPKQPVNTKTRRKTYGSNNIWTLLWPTYLESLPTWPHQMLILPPSKTDLKLKSILQTKTNIDPSMGFTAGPVIFYIGGIITVHLASGQKKDT